MLGRRHRRSLLAALGAVLATVLLMSCSGGSDTTGSTQSAASKAQSASSGQKPNIVYVLTDDLSSNLVKYMPHVRKMQQQGTNFSNNYVTDSLCCPSRSSILTGKYPHNTGVFDNKGDDGGYNAFMKNGNEKNCYAPRLQQAGYRTGFMGKYLNGYQPAEKKGASTGHVPPGWDEWDVAGNGYPEYNYNLNENGKVKHYGHAPKDYLTDVMSNKAKSFVDSSTKAKKPFMLQLSTFAPHGPSTPAPRDKGSFPGLKAPRTEAYDRGTENAPKWQRGLSSLSAKEKQGIDRKFAKRVRSVQAVDDMIGRLQDQLKAQGKADNTYFVFGSDNGFHMGEHQLRPGKQTAYDTDIKVPMTVTGPGVPAGRKVSELTENIDLSPTFQQLAGVQPASSTDGRSLAGLMHGKSESDWRQAVLVEHHHEKDKKGDPDAAPVNTGDPPTYEAIRTADALYVEYAHGEREYYDTKSDPAQLRNRISSLPEDERAKLHKTLTELKKCQGAESCQRAAQPEKS